MSLKLVPPGGRKGYKHWYVRGTLDGERVERSTKATTKRAAQRFLEGLPGALRRPQDVQRQTATFGDALDLYKAWRNPSHNDERYLEALRPKLGHKLLSEISSADLTSAANELYPDGSAATKNRNVIVPAAAVLHHAEACNLCAWIRCRKFKEPKPESRHLSDPQLAFIAIAEAKGDLRLLLTWLFLVGTRITETLTARLEHIDRRARTIRLKIGKSDEWHVYALPADVMRLLPRTTNGWVFPWRSRGGADKHRRELCKRIGFRFTFHQCRHTFGHTIVNAGGTLDNLPHWKDPKSRARYGRPDIERVRADMEMARLPKRGKIGGKTKKRN